MSCGECGSKVECRKCEIENNRSLWWWDIRSEIRTIVNPVIPGKLQLTLKDDLTEQGNIECAIEQLWAISKDFSENPFI